MRTLNYKTTTHANKDKMKVIYKDLLESFKNINFKGRNQTKTNIHNLWNFSELPFGIILSISKLLSIVIILICRKLGSVGHVQQKIKVAFALGKMF